MVWTHAITGLAAGSNTACLEPELLETRRRSLSRLPPIPFSTSIRGNFRQRLCQISAYSGVYGTFIYTSMTRPTSSPSRSPTLQLWF
ncbi:unnamed protein product [Lactuca virosa]|uniref:Uncharacterized protein n=1 Tax=Lactuca virosa TaxID=75947 RepID=A0AAU9LK86_9ASTR|nr:unnamed protein product [Lactuca virosa]